MNKKTLNTVGLSFFVLLVMMSCACHKKNSPGGFADTHYVDTAEELMANDDSGSKGYNSQAAALAIVYKTTKDYFSFVPVILSADKKEIVSYPAPTDVYYMGKLAYPVALKNGYYLDNRGINKYVAFTNYTYEEYAALKSAPSKDELIKRIIDKNPLLEIIYCGPRGNYKNEIVDLNRLIDEGFKGMKVEKIPEMEVEL